MKKALILSLLLASTVAVRAAGVGDIIKDCDVCPALVVIPAGSFQMGDLVGIGNDDERPAHRVTIASPLAVGKYEVTLFEFAKFVNETGYSAGNSCWIVNFESFEAEESSDHDWRNPG